MMSAIGIILAVVLIFSEVMSVNLITRYTIEDEVGPIVVDIHAQGYHEGTSTLNYTSLRNDLLDLEEVDGVGFRRVENEQYNLFPFTGAQKALIEEQLDNGTPAGIDMITLQDRVWDNEPRSVMMVGGDAGYIDILMEAGYDITPPRNNETVISQRMASELNLSVGDTIYLYRIFIAPADGGDEWVDPEDHHFDNATTFVPLLISGTYSISQPDSDALDKAYEWMSSQLFLEENMLFMDIDHIQNITDALWTPPDDTHTEPFYGYWYGGWDDDVYYEYEKPRPLIGQSVDFPGASEPYFYGGQTSFQIRALISLDHDSVLFFEDMTRTSMNLEKIEGRIGGILRDDSLYIEWEGNVLSGAISDMSNEFQAMQMLFLIFTLPLAAVGMYLGYIGTELSVEDRRREIGILKARGMAPSTIRNMFVMESTVIGVIAGLSGIVASILFVRISLGNFAEGFGDRVQMEHILAEFSPATAVMIVLLAIAFTLIGSHRSIKRVSKLSTIETMQFYASSQSVKDYKPGKDITFVSLSVFAVAMQMIFNEIGFENLPGGIVVFFLVIVYAIVGLLTFLVPFMLVVGMTRLTTRYTTKVYTFISRINDRLMPAFSHLIRRTIELNPRRTASLCMIVAMALAFGTFTSSFTDSQEIYEERLAVATIGADLAFVSQQDISGSELLNNTSIKAVSMTYRTSGELIDYGWYTTINAINTTEYTQTVRGLDSYIMMDRDPMGKLSLLKGNDTLITKATADQFGLDVGDTINVQIGNSRYDYWGGDGPGGQQQQAVTLKLRVAGIVRLLPGVMQDEWELYNSDPVIYVDNDTLPTDIYNDSWQFRFMVDLEDGIDENAMVDMLSDGNTWDHQLLSKRLDEGNVLERNVRSFFGIEYTFIIVVVTVGLGLVMTVSVKQREREFAGIVARGASTRDLFKIILGESIIVLILAVSIGAITGIASSFSLLTLFSIDQGDAIRRTLEVTWSTFNIIIFTVLSLLAVSIVVAWRGSMIKLHTALRIRGG